MQRTAKWEINQFLFFYFVFWFFPRSIPCTVVSYEAQTILSIKWAKKGFINWIAVGNNSFKSAVSEWGIFVVHFIGHSKHCKKYSISRTAVHIIVTMPTNTPNAKKCIDTTHTHTQTVNTKQKSKTRNNNCTKQMLQEKLKNMFCFVCIFCQFELLLKKQR